MPPLVTLISATRSPQELFWSHSPLGLSMKRLASIGGGFGNIIDEFDLNVIYRSCVHFSNGKGLSEVYNSSIEERLSLTYAPEVTDEILVFVHDDVWLDDANIGQHLVDGLKEFDVVGVAGSVQRLPGQASWAFLPGIERSSSLEFAFRPNLGSVSGMICQDVEPCGKVGFYGPWRQECELLDGVFLAVRKETLSRTGLRFDSVFGFHFYDLDFCRTARTLGLRLGTWPISITHQSEGSHGEDWLSSYNAYIAKWGD
jgi:GT2 family glycosyltransferase